MFKVLDEMANEIILTTDSEQEVVKKYIEDIMEKKEEILKAFVAKYGFHPDLAEIIHQRTKDGFTVSVRKRNNGKICKIIVCPFCVSFNVDGIVWTNDIDDIKLITYHKNHYRDLGYTIIETFG